MFSLLSCWNADQFYHSAHPLSSLTLVYEQYCAAAVAAPAALPLGILLLVFEKYYAAAVAAPAALPLASSTKG